MTATWEDEVEVHRSAEQNRMVTLAHEARSLCSCCDCVQAGQPWSCLAAVILTELLQREREDFAKGLS